MCVEDILCLVSGNRWSRIQREFAASFFVALLFGLIPLLLVILFNDEENLREEGEVEIQTHTPTGNHSDYSDSGHRLGSQLPQSQSSRKTFSETGHDSSKATVSSKVSLTNKEREEKSHTLPTALSKKGSISTEEVRAKLRETESNKSSGSSQRIDTQYHTRSTRELNDRTLASNSYDKESQNPSGTDVVSKAPRTDNSLKESLPPKTETDTGYFAAPKKFPYLYTPDPSFPKVPQNASQTPTKPGQQTSKSKGTLESVNENSLNFSNSSPLVDFPERFIDPFVSKKNQESRRHLRVKVNGKQNEKNITFANQDQFTDNFRIDEAGKRRSNKLNKSNSRHSSGYQRSKRESDICTTPINKNIRNEKFSQPTPQQHANDQTESSSHSHTIDPINQVIKNKKTKLLTSKLNGGNHNGLCSLLHEPNTLPEQNIWNEVLESALSPHYKDDRKPHSVTPSFEEKCLKKKRNLLSFDQSADIYTKWSDQFQIEASNKQSLNEKSNLIIPDRPVNSQIESNFQLQQEVAECDEQSNPTITPRHCSLHTVASSIEKSSSKENPPSVLSNSDVGISSASKEKYRKISSSPEQLKSSSLKEKCRVDSSTSEPVKNSPSNEKCTISKQTCSLNTDASIGIKSKGFDDIITSDLEISDRKEGNAISRINKGIEDITCEKNVSAVIKQDIDELIFTKKHEIRVAVKDNNSKCMNGILNPLESDVEQKQSTENEPRVIVADSRSKQSTFELKKTKHLENFENTLEVAGKRTQQRVSMLATPQTHLLFSEIENKECIIPDTSKSNGRFIVVQNGCVLSIKETPLENDSSNLVPCILTQKEESANESLLLKDFEIPNNPSRSISVCKKGDRILETFLSSQLPVPPNKNTHLESIFIKGHNTHPFLEPSSFDEIHMKTSHLNEKTTLKSNNPFVKENLSSLKNGFQILPNVDLKEREILDNKLASDQTTTKEKFIEKFSFNFSYNEPEQQSKDLRLKTQKKERICRELYNLASVSETYLDTAASSLYNDNYRTSKEHDSAANVFVPRGKYVVSGYSNSTSSSEKLPPYPLTSCRTISQISFGVFEEGNECIIEKGEEKEERKREEVNADDDDENLELDYNKHEIEDTKSYCGKNSEIDVSPGTNYSDKVSQCDSAVVTNSTSEGRGNYVIIQDNSEFYFDANKKKHVHISKEQMDTDRFDFFLPSAKTPESNMLGSEEIPLFLLDEEDQSFYIESEFPNRNTTCRNRTNYNSINCFNSKCKVNTTCGEDIHFDKFQTRVKTLTQIPPDNAERRGKSVVEIEEDQPIRRLFSSSPRTSKTLNASEEYCCPRGFHSIVCGAADDPRLSISATESETNRNTSLETNSSNKDYLIPETKLQFKDLFVANVQTYNYKSYTLCPKPIGLRTKESQELNIQKDLMNSTLCTWSDIAKSKSK